MQEVKIKKSSFIFVNLFVAYDLKLVVECCQNFKKESVTHLFFLHPNLLIKLICLRKCNKNRWRKIKTIISQQSFGGSNQIIELETIDLTVDLTITTHCWL